MNLTKGLTSAVAFGMVVTSSLAAAEVSQPVASSSDIGSLAGACAAPAAGALTDAQMQGTVGGAPIDGICFVAGICSSVWPFGTLICGPTAVGCVVHYWTY
jgi:hypothetical protein